MAAPAAGSDGCGSEGEATATVQHDNNSALAAAIDPHWQLSGSELQGKAAWAGLAAAVEAKRAAPEAAERGLCRVVTSQKGNWHKHKTARAATKPKDTDEVTPQGTPRAAMARQGSQTVRTDTKSDSVDADRAKRGV